VPSSAAKLLELLDVRPEERGFYELNGTKRIAPGSTLPPPVPVFPRYVEPEAKA
jgi:methionyl-tRNA synthetase